MSDSGNLEIVEISTKVKQMRNEEEERKGKERGNVIINLKNKERN
jgi:hypothetical protein